MRGTVRPRERKLAAMDRRKQLLSIAMNQIAARGFEGLRFEEVAKLAGINNATLCYHFPTKEALIQGVVGHLNAEVKRTRPRVDRERRSALDELRQEFQDLRDLLRAHPKLFIVLTELSLRGLRDPVLGKMDRTRDGLWRDHLAGIIRRGIEQGVFRTSTEPASAVSGLMAQFKGIGYHSALGKRTRREADQMIAEIARQVEHWLTCVSK